MGFSPSGIPGLGAWRGYDEVRSFFADDWFQAFLLRREVELDELIDNGDKVITLRATRSEATSGVSRARTGHIFTLRDAEVVQGRDLPRPRESLEAAGIAYIRFAGERRDDPAAVASQMEGDPQIWDMR